VELIDHLPRTDNNSRFDIIRVEYGEDMKLTSFRFVFQIDMQLKNYVKCVKFSSRVECNNAKISSASGGQSFT
jgi:hypothetical protein